MSFTHGRCRRVKTSSPRRSRHHDVGVLAFPAVNSISRGGGMAGSVVHQHTFFVFRFEEQFVLGFLLGETGEELFEIAIG